MIIVENKRGDRVMIVPRAWGGDLWTPSDGQSEPLQVLITYNNEKGEYGRLRRFRGALDVLLDIAPE